MNGRGSTSSSLAPPALPAKKKSCTRRTSVQTNNTPSGTTCSSKRTGKGTPGGGLVNDGVPVIAVLLVGFGRGPSVIANGESSSASSEMTIGGAAAGSSMTMTGIGAGAGAGTGVIDGLARGTGVVGFEGGAGVSTIIGA